MILLQYYSIAILQHYYSIKVTKANIENCVQLPILDWWPLKNLLCPPFNQGYSFGASFRVGCVPRNPFEEEKGFTLHCIKMTCEKLIQIAITISTTFTASPSHCQGARLTWNQGFTSSEQQVGWRFACTGTIFFCKLTSAFAWTRLLGAGVLPPRHLARQLTNLVALECYFSLPLGSLSLKKCPS